MVQKDECRMKNGKLWLFLRHENNEICLENFVRIEGKKGEVLVSASMGEMEVYIGAQLDAAGENQKGAPSFKVNEECTNNSMRWLKRRKAKLVPVKDGGTPLELLFESRGFLLQVWKKSEWSEHLNKTETVIIQYAKYQLIREGQVIEEWQQNGDEYSKSRTGPVEGDRQLRKWDTSSFRMQIFNMPLQWGGNLEPIAHIRMYDGTDIATSIVCAHICSLDLMDDELKPEWETQCPGWKSPEVTSSK